MHRLSGRQGFQRGRQLLSPAAGAAYYPGARIAPMRGWESTPETQTQSPLCLPPTMQTPMESAL